MIKSKYISDILHYLAERSDEDRDHLRKQIEYLTDSEYEYTGVGLFVSFLHSEEIHPFRVPLTDGAFGNVTIASKDLATTALAWVFLKDGLIDCLEILGHGCDYPTRDLRQYEFSVRPVNVIDLTNENSPRRK